MATQPDWASMGVETVGQLLGDAPPAPVEPEGPLIVPVIDGYPHAFPGTGIHFGMAEEDYHAVPALSTSQIKQILASPADFWWQCRWLRAEATEREESSYMALGSAWHKRVLEGREAFYQRYAIDIDPRDFPEALRTVDELKAAIIAAGGETKGCKSKADYVARADDLGLCAWDSVIAAHAAANEGVQLISADDVGKIELSAAMIERHPDLKDAFVDGYPEVSIFWECERTGVPMKARLDYLKLMAIVDLKTFSNPLGKQVDRAIVGEMAGRRYYVQAPVYCEAVKAAKAAIRKHGMSAVHGDVDPQFLEDWIDPATPDPTFLFVFQKSAGAPVTRGMVLDGVSNVFTIGQGQALAGKQAFARHCRFYGSDPWIDFEPIAAFEDEAFPAWLGE